MTRQKQKRKENCNELTHEPKGLKDWGAMIAEFSVLLNVHSINQQFQYVWIMIVFKQEMRSGNLLAYLTQNCFSTGIFFCSRCYLVQILVWNQVFQKLNFCVMEGWTDQQTDRLMDTAIDRLTDGQTEGWTDRETLLWPNYFMSVHSLFSISSPSHSLPYLQNRGPLRDPTENSYPDFYRFADINIGICIYRYWFANDVIAHNIILIGGKMENQSFWSIWNFSMVFFSLTRNPWDPEHCMVLYCITLRIIYQTRPVPAS